MTDVEKIKTYLSIEDAQEQSYYLKEIMPISPKDKNINLRYADQK